jgi:hypothetical protein
MATLTPGIRRFSGALAWFLVVVLIALGAAGLVAGLDHPPGTAGRADLTAAGDAQVTQLLDAAEADLVALADQVDALGIQARGTLAALNGSDPTTGDAAIEAGNRLILEIASRTAAFRDRLAAVPYIGTDEVALHLSDAVVARHAGLASAIGATDGLQAGWARLTIGSRAATRMSLLLAEHDRLVAAAAEQGRGARYTEALTTLDGADAQIASARQLRTQLAETVDVTVLDQWLDRNAAYDVALRGLYKAISTVRGRVTDDVRKAITVEAAARARLPADTRGLVVIMADIGRGGMNGAVIAIEEARGRLAAALRAATAPASPEPETSPAP